MNFALCRGQNSLREWVSSSCKLINVLIDFQLTITYHKKTIYFTYHAIECCIQLELKKYTWQLARNQGQWPAHLWMLEM